MKIKPWLKNTGLALLIALAAGIGCGIGEGTFNAVQNARTQKPAPIKTSKHVQAASKKARMRNIFKQGATDTYAETDPKTGVEYLVIASRLDDNYMTIIPRLNANGKPIISSAWLKEQYKKEKPYNTKKAKEALLKKDIKDEIKHMAKQAVNKKWFNPQPR